MVGADPRPHGPPARSPALDELERRGEVPDDAVEVSTTLLTQLRHTRSSGPLPPAEEFAAYDEAMPGAAHRILAMAERRADHSMEMERRTLVVNEQIAFGGLAYQRRGQVFALVIALAGMGTSAALAALHAQTAALAAALGTVVSLGGAFITGKVLEYKQSRSEGRPRSAGHPGHGGGPG